MSAAYYIVVEGEPSRQSKLDGKALARDSRGINQLAKANGLPTLDDFFSLSADEAIACMANTLGIDIEEMSDEDTAIARKAGDDKWFDPSQGIDFCYRLTELIKADRALVSDAKSVLRDLCLMNTELKSLLLEGRRWRFQIDY